VSLIKKTVLLGLAFTLIGTGIPANAVVTHGLTLPDNGDFLVYWTPERLQQARAWRQANPSWTPRGAEPMRSLDRAFLYVLTGTATPETQEAMNYLMSLNFAVDSTGQLGSNDARWFGEHAALMYNWLKPLLTPSQKNTLLGRWNHFIRSCLQKPWGGPNMPESNYYWGFTRNAFLWALATYNDSFVDANTGQTQRQVAEELLDNALNTRWAATEIPFLNGRSKGGVFPEGSHYGPYLIQYYAMMMAIAEQFGRPLYNETNYFKEVPFHILYATTPKPSLGKRISESRYQLFTYGDLQDAEGSPDPRSPDYAEPMFLYANHFSGLPIAGFIRRWLNVVNPLAITFPSDSVTSRHVVSIDTGAGQTGTPFSQLPLDYFNPGSSFFYTRSTWGAAPSDKPMVVYMQGQYAGAHAHRDAGSFQILRNDRWLSEEASGYSVSYTGYDGTGSIGSEEPGTSNTLLFNYVGPIDQFYQVGWPQATRLESRPEYAYMSLNLTPAYQATDARRSNPYAGSLTREFIHLKALDTLVVFDRMGAVGANGLTSADVPKTFLLHFPFNPSVSGNIISSVYGTEEIRAISLTSAVAGQSNTTYQVIDESTHMSGAASTIDPQFRLQVNTQGSPDSYHIHVIQTKSTADSNITATLTENSNELLITLTRPGHPNTVLTFQKGMASSGGSIVIGGQSFNLNTTVQVFSVTDSGPVWGALGGSSGSTCDLNSDSSTNVSDVQLCANQAIGVIGCTTGDINHDSSCNVVDVQRVVNAALGGQCATQ
jgi:hypothetical protein